MPARDTIQQGMNADRGSRRLAAWMGVSSLALAAAMVLLYYARYPSGVGKVQPIPFSHKLHAGDKQISCLMCHSIVKVKGTMGQGDFTLEYPVLHALAASRNPTMRKLHDFMVRLNPEPHRRVFLKPFMRDQVPEWPRFTGSRSVGG